jgi:transcriptional regulator with XRE-family HTH domain
LGLSQAQLGAKAGCDGQTVSNFESGRTTGFKLTVAGAIARVLEVPEEMRGDFIEAITERKAARKRSKRPDRGG